MSVDDAARELAKRLIGSEWLTSVGVGDLDGREAIYVYVKVVRKRALEFLRDGWMGHPVVIKRTGDVVPAEVYQNAGQIG